MEERKRSLNRLVLKKSASKGGWELLFTARDITREPIVMAILIGNYLCSGFVFRDVARAHIDVLG